MANESSGELVDWHSHCFLAEHKSKEALAERAAYGVRGSDNGTPERHRAAMEEAGVGKFVVVNVPWRKGHETPNKFIADYVAGYPGRAIGLASVHPNDPGAAQEFEHSVRDLGIKGLKLSPVYQSFDPWTPDAYRLFEIAQDYEVPVMFHMGGMYDPHASLQWSNPLLLDKVGLDFPNLRIIVAHLGQPHMEETVMLLRKNKNMFADLSARYHRQWQLYNGLQVAIEYKVTDRLLFGSDFPVMTPREAETAFKGINDWGDGIRLPPIPPALIEDILYQRPFELLGL